MHTSRNNSGCGKMAFVTVPCRKRLKVFWFRQVDRALSFLACNLIRLVSVLPLNFVLWAGRAAGECVFWIDSRHRKVALGNLTRCFSAEKSETEIHGIARENFRRIGESFVSSLKMAFMDRDSLCKHVQIKGAEHFLQSCPPNAPQTRIIAFGHFGNFELLARMNQLLPPYRGVATYRGIQYPRVERLLRSIRERWGCHFFERRADSAQLRAVMKGPGLMLGLAADQHTRGGLPLPFLGTDCATSAAPAVFALRYKCPLYAAVCYRVGLGQWRIEFSEEIPTRFDGEPRSTAAIMTDVNRAFEEAVRRDPPNWFWVHNRWKTAPRKTAPQAELNLACPTAV
jgi:lauroyl/myristoyl acyltransferase